MKRLRLIASVVGALVVAGCGSFGGGPDGDDRVDNDEQAVPEDSGKSEDPSKAALEDKPRDDTKTDDTKADDPGRDDPKEPRATALADDDAKRPIELYMVEVKPQGGLFGANALEISTKGTLRERIDSATYVHAKTVCRSGNRFLTDTGFVNADYRKPLADHEVGETVELTGRFFMQVDQEIKAPCQIEFRLAGGGGGGISIPLETACFAGEETKLGACSPPVAATAVTAAAGKPMRVLDLAVKPPALGTKNGLNVSYVLEVKDSPDSGTRITLKAACQVDDVKLVDLDVANLMAGPFRFESGESVARSSALFFNPAFGFVEAPEQCDLEVAAWTQKKGSFDGAERILLSNSCYREGRVSAGPCDGSRTPRPAPSPVDSDSVKVDRVSMDVVEPYGAKGNRFQLKIQADALIEKPVDQFSSIDATVTCRVDNTVRVETAYLRSVELHYLDPGETTRMTGTTFTGSPMDKLPRSCEAEFTAGRRFSPSGNEKALLGKWCLRKGITKRGKC